MNADTNSYVYISFRDHFVSTSKQPIEIHIYKSCEFYSIHKSWIHTLTGHRILVAAFWLTINP